MLDGSPLLGWCFSCQVLSSVTMRRVPEECSRTVASLITACLVDDPDCRPTARELVDSLSKVVQEGAAAARIRAARRPSAVRRRQPRSQTHAIGLNVTSWALKHAAQDQGVCELSTDCHLFAVRGR